MKTINLLLPNWLKTFRPYTALDASIRVKKNPGTVNPSKEEADKSRQLALKELQRKAHVGNFFAGPHCFFDPRLFR